MQVNVIEQGEWKSVLQKYSKKCPSKKAQPMQQSKSGQTYLMTQPDTTAWRLPGYQIGLSRAWMPISV